jgi:hypothetical protein
MPIFSLQSLHPKIPFPVIRFSFDRLRLQYRLRNLAFADFMEVVGDYTESLALCRHHYKEGGLGPADPLPADVAAPDRQQPDAEVVFITMLNAVFVVASRATLTKELLDQWATGAANAGLSAIVAPWLEFVTALFIGNSISTETAMRDQSLPWTWQAAASIRVAVENSTRPAELLTVHYYWTNVLPSAAAGLYVLAEIEQLVTRGWLRLSEQRFLLRTPAVTVPGLLQACASTSSGWRKIGEVLNAACDVVPATVPKEFRERFRQLR